MQTTQVLFVIAIILLLGFCVVLVLGLLSVLQQFLRTGVHEQVASDAAARPPERPPP